ncbi:DUF4145 domain-containing protein [Sabulibacter ruber]|uniref:DUF4145 domain-containing protein n=1 Tax=Sabulibacter ruber TaxID=2811901 RepID=UPI001A9707F8|nr:DUF4145 domain-containing protein [Sabulibacter ruber]
MLRHIPEQNFTNTEITHDYEIPISVDSTCPHCRRKVNFSIQWLAKRTYVVEYALTHCPACQEKTTFIYLTKKRENKPIRTGHLFIHPSNGSREPLSGVQQADNMQEGLKKAYFSAINVLNAHEWTATSVLCRRVLEGITKSVVPEEDKNKPLATQLKGLSKHIDLEEPIITLADAIRKGGNLGAHFDLEKEPTEEISQLMVEMLDYLIEYIFILPNRIKSLHDKIEALSYQEQPND